MFKLFKLNFEVMDENRKFTYKETFILTLKLFIIASVGVLVFSAIINVVNLVYGFLLVAPNWFNGMLFVLMFFLLMWLGLHLYMNLVEDK